MLKIALAQFNSKILDLNFNKEKMLLMIKEAAFKGADVIVFPELFSIGYNLEIVGENIDSIIETKNTPLVLAACKSALENKIYVIIGVPYKENGKRYNSAIIIDKKGNIVDIYKKNNLWFSERKYFDYGDNEFRVYEAEFGKFGVVICYDVDYPETCRKLALNGADIIFVVSAWDNSYRRLWDVYLPARALENTVYIAAVNRVGVEENLIYFGNSKVYDPTAKLLASAVNCEEILYCDIDIQSISKIREEFPYLKEIRD